MSYDPSREFGTLLRRPEYEAIVQSSGCNITCSWDQTNEEGPSYSESAEIDSLVEVMGSSLDLAQELGFLFGQTWRRRSLDSLLFAIVVDVGQVVWVLGFVL